MDYKKHYDALVSRAQSRTINEYTETHHILPKCLGGTDELHNLVELTPEEHYLAHQLLVKIHPESRSLVFSAHMMGSTRKSNKVYGWLRRKYIESCTGISKSEETRKNMSTAKQNYVPWNAGLNTGIVTSGCFKKGNTPWNKGRDHLVGDKNPSFGKKWNNEKRHKMSLTNKGRKRMYRDDGTFYYIYPHLQEVLL